MLQRTRRFIIASTAVLGSGLGACDLPEAAETESAAQAPTFEEFEASTEQVSIGEHTYYLVESDILVEGPEQLGDYYDEMYGSGFRSIVNLVGGVRDIRADPMNITYCFVDGWGQNQGLYTAPALDPVRNSVAAAAAQWEAAGPVNFVYRPERDGAGCSATGTDPVSFIVRHWSSSSTATGSFPSMTDQALQVPVAGLGTSLAAHELGHILGLRHEHIHSGASPQCSESGTWEELTAYDAQSAMRYSNCTTSNVIGGFPVSALDAQGLQELYGGGSTGNDVSCHLNSPSASHGGFGIHNSYVENTTGSAIQGWSIEISFGTATPQAQWSWGGTYSNVGQSVIITGTQTLQPGQREYFGVGGTYSGGTPTVSCS